VLLPGYDFTRNQAGASEWLDAPQLQSSMQESGDQQAPAYVQQSSVAVLDQSSVAVLDGGPYAAFGHGTMTSGLVHLVAPKASILPLKAFTSDGTGYLSNIVAALYYAVQHKANVVNMSFDLTSSSPSLTQAVAYANKSGVVLVAAAGNENTSAAGYPAASFSSPIVAGTVSLMLSAKQQAANQSQAASALSHGRPLSSDLNHGRLDVYQAVSAWVNNSGSTSGSGSGSCFLFCW
jgi:subtilisin family serine protease